jgi:hypothetical protein
MIEQPRIARELARRLRERPSDASVREDAALALESLADLYERTFRMLERLKK